MSESVSVISAHNFLYSDRHQKLYPHMPVYLEGDDGKIGPFLQLLEEGKTALEICQLLKIRYRGDVLFATLLAHFQMRDGLLASDSFVPEIPPELLADFPRYEAEWRAARAEQHGEH